MIHIKNRKSNFIIILKVLFFNSSFCSINQYQIIIVINSQRRNQRRTINLVVANDAKFFSFKSLAISSVTTGIKKRKQNKLKGFLFFINILLIIKKLDFIVSCFKLYAMYNQNKFNHEQFLLKPNNLSILFFRSFSFDPTKEIKSIKT